MKKLIFLFALSGPVFANCGNNGKDVGNGCNNDGGTTVVNNNTTVVNNTTNQPVSVVTQQGADNLQQQINAMNEFRTYFEPEVQVFDTKHWSGSISDRIWIQDGGHNQAVIAHLKFRLGPDHNDEQVDKLRAQVRALETELRKLQ